MWTRRRVGGRNQFMLGNVLDYNLADIVLG
jgi:hypothetical protein